MSPCPIEAHLRISYDGIYALIMDDPETKRLSRLVALLALLQTKRLITATALADRFAVSTRTIYRDMRALENAGVPILTHEGKGYGLLEGYRLPPLPFTEQEANALVTAERLISASGDVSLIRFYQQAIGKIKATLRYDTRDKANQLSGRIKIYPATQPAGRSDYLSTLQSALTHCRLVQLHYQAADSEQTNRTVEPFALLSTRDNWLLVGWCHLRKAYRIFRLDRIVTLTVLPDTFPAHPLTLSQFFATYH